MRMEAAFAALAAFVAIGHAAFVVFAAFGALLALRWPRIAWLQLPAAAWAAYIELSGGVCPLTPLENELRRHAGLDLYSGDFVARYLFPVLYPVGLTRQAQIAAAFVVLAINISVYGWIMRTKLISSRSTE
jgi:hypothetical protein